MELHRRYTIKEATIARDTTTIFVKSDRCIVYLHSKDKSLYAPYKRGFVFSFMSKFENKKLALQMFNELFHSKKRYTMKIVILWLTCSNFFWHIFRPETFLKSNLSSWFSKTSCEAKTMCDTIKAVLGAVGICVVFTVMSYVCYLVLCG